MVVFQPWQHSAYEYVRSATRESIRGMEWSRVRRRRVHFNRLKPKVSPSLTFSGLWETMNYAWIHSIPHRRSRKGRRRQIASISPTLARASKLTQAGHAVDAGAGAFAAKDPDGGGRDHEEDHEGHRQADQQGQVALQHAILRSRG